MKTCVILASGPSLTVEQIHGARRSGHDTIVVNSTWEKMPDARYLYAGDFLWWKMNVATVRKQFKGECWSQDRTAVARWPEIKYMRGVNRDGLGNAMIHNAGNSGAQAINLAYLWGYRRIVLLGFDMKLGPHGEKHHHDDHPHPMVQGQVFYEWILKITRMAVDLEKAGCEVINCTPLSALSCFQMKNWENVLCGS